MRKSLWVIAVVVLVAIGAPIAGASSVDGIVAFGDSLSDVGNVFLSTGGAVPGAPYVGGQFTNGNVWVQDLASDLGLPALQPSLAGGSDYAYGTGETGVEPFNTSNAATDLLGATGQIAQFEAGHALADPNSLYTIWIGANDLSDILTNANPSQFATDLGIVAGNVDTAINDLAAIGAKNFLVVTVPDLGFTPELQAAGPIVAGAASALSAGFDDTLVDGSGPIPSLSALASGDSVNISVLDTFSLLDDVVADPSLYGFTNASHPCLVGEVDYSGGTPCANPSQYLFWDELHPTAAGHALVADGALAAIRSPEPSSLILLVGGLLSLLALAARRKRLVPSASY